MQVVRLSHDEAIAYGIIDGEDVVVLDGDPMFAGFQPTAERIPLAEVTLLAPSIPRSKVVCVGKNYHDHAAEMGGVAPEAPLLFLKPNTAVIGPGDAIVIPPQSKRVDFEGELAVVIGRVAKNVKAADAADYIFGYTVALDMTARDLQQADGQWARGKGFDTFCPLGPVIETEFEVAASGLTTRVNGEVAQHAPFTAMIHSVADIIEYSSSVWTMLPGDVILTGTPAGVGPVVSGDEVSVEIPGIGILRNPVR
ncbi:fumarylacetoacetate hydrolase family protein [Klugiella xanthotipulae]|uniref:2-keto-4-pentenoate hydratase/2-oxohepta-3-ene-1,7-dioic acid hydratase in catechol pathway n=1 Tax=Klugiella xanthotipulae TaxID=244735 RepID=A0A543I4C2_9MICO|nr:fumarylacetoacetate hydrolase family protein [Klugiella xanthotipulae]TQM65391.1 2-keto-4-pentenoate hydratase/2-oxohepta-3-ene-1,7-dioic acid hydratase in catechol pathway [Klugiella xanthotipulae]